MHELVHMPITYMSACVQSKRDKKVTGGILERSTQLWELRRLQCNVKACGEDRHSCAEA